MSNADAGKAISAVIAAGPFDKTWESLGRYQVPTWYQDAKFGIFIHWGVYAVPAFGNEWYPRNMYIQGSPEFTHHLSTYGPQKDFGYKGTRKELCIPMTRRPIRDVHEPLGEVGEPRELGFHRHHGSLG